MEDDLSQRITALSEQVAALRKENRALWANMGQGPTEDGPGPEEDSPGQAVSRRGLLTAAAASAAAGLIVGRASPAAAANGDPVRLGQLNTASVNTTVQMSGGSAAALFGEATASSGFVSGIYGRSHSTSGRGLSGVALAQSGENYGVYGQSNSTRGRGVFGRALQSSGTTYGVFGQAASPDGYGVFSSGRFKATGRSFLATPNSPPPDRHLSNGTISFFLDEGSNKLRIRVRYSDGTLKTGSVNLT